MRQDRYLCVLYYYLCHNLSTRSLFPHPAPKDSCRSTGCLQPLGNTCDKGTNKRGKYQRKTRFCQLFQEKCQRFQENDCQPFQERCQLFQEIKPTPTAIPEQGSPTRSLSQKGGKIQSLSGFRGNSFNSFQGLYAHTERSHYRH